MENIFFEFEITLFMTLGSRSSRGGLSKRYTENVQQVYSRALWQSVISIKLLTLWHGRSPVNFLHNLKTPFLSEPGKNRSVFKRNCDTL